MYHIQCHWTGRTDILSDIWHAFVQPDGISLVSNLFSCLYRHGIATKTFIWDILLFLVTSASIEGKLCAIPSLVLPSIPCCINLSLEENVCLTEKGKRRKYIQRMTYISGKNLLLPMPIPFWVSIPQSSSARRQASTLLYCSIDNIQYLGKEGRKTLNVGCEAVLCR